MGVGWQISDAIRRRSARHPSDAELRAASAGRHHTFTLAELRAQGLSDRAVGHRVDAGRLRRLHAGVFCVGEPTTDTRWMAAVRACGDGALLSHRSAAALWGLIRADGRSVDVTVEGRRARTRAGIAVHSGAALDAEDRASHRSIPCTSVARTLLDLAAGATPRRIELAVAQADLLRLFDLREVRAVLARNPRRPGAPALRHALAAATEPAVTRSEFEECLFAALARAGLPRPRVNAFVALEDNTGYHPDFLWPEAGLIVEADSEGFHASHARRRHDARRDRRLRLAGLETFRWTGEDPAELVADVVAHLARAARAPVARSASWR